MNPMHEGSLMTNTNPNSDHEIRTLTDKTGGNHEVIVVNTHV